MYLETKQNVTIEASGANMEQLLVGLLNAVRGHATNNDNETFHLVITTGDDEIALIRIDRSHVTDSGKIRVIIHSAQSNE